MATPNSALQQYQKVDAHSATAYASPHRLIQMLMESSLESLTKASGHIQRGELELKGMQISRAVGLIGGLREGLNLETGELAANLDALYDYMQRRLVEANRQADPTMVEEVINLLRPIKDAWDAIGTRPEAATLPPADAPA